MIRFYLMIIPLLAVVKPQTRSCGYFKKPGHAVNFHYVTAGEPDKQAFLSSFKFVQ